MHNGPLFNILWAYHHLGVFDRDSTILPVIPDHSLPAVLAIKIPTIQVGDVAAIVPPGASIYYLLHTFRGYGDHCHDPLWKMRNRCDCEENLLQCLEESKGRKKHSEKKARFNNSKSLL